MGKDTINIKVSVAGRSYRLNVGMDEEASVRKGAERINERVRELQSSYAVEDEKDLLAMAALEMASERTRLEQEGQQELNETISSLSEMEQRIEDHLEQGSSTDH